MIFVQRDAAEEAVTSCRLRRARRVTAKLRGRLQNAVDASDEHRVRGLIYRLLNTYSCKLAAIDEANQSLRESRRVPRGELFYLADKLDAWRGSQEPVRLSAKPKASGGVRPIMEFGLQNRALQRLVRWALHSWISARLHERQHALRGGRTPAVRATKQMMEEGNHKYGIELDIRDMYGSINPDWLKENLPIPPAVVDAICTAQHMNIQPIDHIAMTHMHRSRSGIPQGSAVSPLLSEFVVSSILASIPNKLPCQTYVDNIAISAKSEEETRSHQNILVRHIEAHPAGFFQVRSTPIKRLDSGFSYLGYMLKKRRRVAVVGVSETRQESLVERVEAIWSCVAPDEAAALFIKTYRLILGWTAGHSLWRGSCRMERELWNHVIYLIPYPDRRALGLAAFFPDDIYP